MEKALFKGIRDFIIGYLNRANKKIVIAVAWFTNDDLFQAILNALDKNIQVELVLIDDCINRNELGLDFSVFITKGGHLFFSTSEKNMHNKFCVIDNGIVITDSYNWTYYAENRNWENILVTDEESVINEYCKEFESIKAQLEETREYKHYVLNEIEPLVLLNNYDYLLKDLKYKSNTIGIEYNNYLSALKENIVIERRKSVEIPHHIAPVATKIVTQHSLGIRCTIDGKENCTSFLIPQGTKIPCEMKGVYLTSIDNQTTLECETLLGDNVDANQNRSIGKIVLNDIPPLPKGQGRMEVSFRISSDKVLHVTATNLHTQNIVQANYDNLKTTF